MSLINEVKKVLRDSGVEMDADDVTGMLSKQPRYRRLVARTQVGGSLAALCASDADIVRTRPGLYRYERRREDVQPTAIDPALAPAIATRLEPDPRRVPPQRVLAPRTEPVLVVADESYLRDKATGACGRICRSVPRRVISQYLADLAQLRWARTADVVWCRTSTAAIAELTRIQHGSSDVVVLGDTDLVQEGMVTAQRLGRPIDVWTLTQGDVRTPEFGAGPTSAIYQICVDDLVARMPTSSFEGPVPMSVFTEEVDTPPSETSPGPAGPSGALGCLRFLDESLYRRRIDRVTGRGNSHALRKQALLTGQTYVQRWLSVVNDETRERLRDAQANGSVIPERIYPDLTSFAEIHGLRLHASHDLTEQLCRGFWKAVSGPAETTSHPVAA